MKRAMALLPLGIGLALAAPAAAPAADGLSYGGATLIGGRLSGSSIALLQRPDGMIRSRVGLGYSCGRNRTYFPNVVVRLRGTVTGAAFTATGSTRMNGRGGRLRLRLAGTLDGQTANGTLRVRARRMGRCLRGFSRQFVLRADRAVAGAPAGPRAGVVLGGVTGQETGGIRLPIAVRVTRNGRRVAALWQAFMRCGPRAVDTVVNFSPTTLIRRDGRFRRNERYTLRYRDGFVERIRVTFRGRFLADGAVGVLRARMLTSKRGSGTRYHPCDSGPQRWSASG